MQALNASNEQFRVQAALLEKSSGVYSTWVFERLNSKRGQRTQKDLPMLNEKKTSELIETSIIYLLSAAVAAGAFVLVGLIALLFGLGQT